VYDFAATAADVPAYSTLAGQASEGATPQTAEQIATGRQLGAEIGSQARDENRQIELPGDPFGGRRVPRLQAQRRDVAETDGR